MDLTEPPTMVTTPVMAAVLRVLTGSDAGFTGREVHRLAGAGTPPTVRAALDRLVDHGVCSAKAVGRGRHYRLNRSHLASEHLVALAGLRFALFDRIADLTGRWRPPPTHVSVFGSSARGDSSPTSDLDLLVIRSDEVHPEDADWFIHRQELADQVSAWSGNHLSVFELSVSELRAAVMADEPIVAAWRTEGIRLTGSHLGALTDSNR